MTADKATEWLIGTMLLHWLLGTLCFICSGVSWKFLVVGAAAWTLSGLLFIGGVIGEKAN